MILGRKCHKNYKVTATERKYIIKETGEVVLLSSQIRYYDAFTP